MTNGWSTKRIRLRVGSDIDALICPTMALELSLPAMEASPHLQGLRVAAPDPSVSAPVCRRPAPVSSFLGRPLLLSLPRMP